MKRRINFNNQRATIMIAVELRVDNSKHAVPNSTKRVVVVVEERKSSLQSEKILK